MPLSCLPLVLPAVQGAFPPVTAHHAVHSNVCSLLHNRLQLLATLTWKLMLACSCDKILWWQGGQEGGILTMNIVWSEVVF